jgi:alpha-D-ribose 1-methylphosphonate 5-triphosphate synthase subunit PhnL
LIVERKRRGVAILAIVHDPNVRDRIADTVIDISRFAAVA